MGSDWQGTSTIVALQINLLLVDMEMQDSAPSARTDTTTQYAQSKTVAEQQLATYRQLVNNLQANIQSLQTSNAALERELTQSQAKNRDAQLKQAELVNRTLLNSQQAAQSTAAQYTQRIHQLQQQLMSLGAQNQFIVGELQRLKQQQADGSSSSLDPQERTRLTQQAAECNQRLQAAERLTKELQEKWSAMEGARPYTINMQASINDQTGAREQVMQQNMMQVVWARLATMYATGKSQSQLRRTIESISAEYNERATLLMAQNRNVTSTLSDPMQSTLDQQIQTLQAMYQFYAKQFVFDNQHLDQFRPATINVQNPELVAHAILHLRRYKQKSVAQFLGVGPLESLVLQTLMKDFVPDLALVQ